MYLNEFISSNTKCRRILVKYCFSKRLIFVNTLLLSNVFCKSKPNTLRIMNRITMNITKCIVNLILVMHTLNLYSLLL